MAEKYIPVNRSGVIELASAALPEEQRGRFRYFARLTTAWFHHEFHEQLESQKEDFRVLGGEAQGKEREETARRFAARLHRLVRAANFTPILEEELNQALAEESTFRIRLDVRFDDFEELVFYRRGQSQRTAEVPSWFGLRKRPVEFTNYDRVLVYVRFADSPTLPPETRGSVVLKLFANVPKADLEMLFPNSEVRMRLTDKLFIGVPAFVSALVVLTTRVGSALLLAGALLAFWAGMSDERVELDQAALVGLVTGAGALGAYLWKQFNSFKNRKIRFMKALTEHLYFRNLDNNTGVLTHMTDFAEEAETKEVLLAYASLLVHGAQTEPEISAAVRGMLAIPDAVFDVKDAVAKLVDLELVDGEGDRYHPKPLEAAIDAIDTRWDGLFSSGA